MTLPGQLPHPRPLPPDLCTLRYAVDGQARITEGRTVPARGWLAVMPMDCPTVPTITHSTFARSSVGSAGRRVGADAMYALPSRWPASSCSFPETSLATSGRSGSHRTPRTVLMSRARLVTWVGNHPVFWPTTRTRHVRGASADEGWQLSERVRLRGCLQLPGMQAFHSPARSRNS
ncbi:MAG: hypothetical protein RL022_2249 [Chloroflexota bacterium]